MTKKVWAGPNYLSNLTESTLLVERIREFWHAKGKSAMVWVEPSTIPLSRATPPTPMYVIRSDMVGGMPTKMGCQ